MKITYDKKIDAMYIKLGKGSYDYSKKITDDILVDVSRQGMVMGVEILQASKNIGKIKREKIPVEFSGAQI